MAGGTVSAKELLAAANEAARREATQWFFFVTVMLYLTVAVGSVTHRKLFFDEPIPLPVISVAVPLTGFFVVAPAIMLILHFYVLAQARVLREKLAAAVAALRAEGGGAEGAAAGQGGVNPAWFQVDPYPVAQAVAGAMFGQGALPLRVMAWLTLIAAPVLLLLFFQVRFLPYQDPATTWWHRVLVVADLGLVWWLWRPVAQERALAVVPPGRVAIAAKATLSVFATFFSVVLATIPEEEWEQRQPGAGALARFVVLATIPEEAWTQLQADAGALVRPAVSLKEWLFDGGVDATTNRPASPFSRELVLPNERLISEAQAELLRKIGAGELKADERQPDPVARTEVLRGRSFRRAVFAGSDLRRVDLTGADLRGVRLHQAWLQGAYWERSQLQDADLSRAQLQGANLGGAQLQRAYLWAAQLQGADLREAQLQGADLQGAQLQGADLNRAQLQGAYLWGAQLQGADLQGAQLQGANLGAAQLQGANLRGAQLQGANLRWAQLQGANLGEAQLQGADLQGAQLQGADLHGAQLQAADLRHTALWRAYGLPELEDSDLRGAHLHERAPTDDAGQPAGWRDWVERRLATIPPGDRRERARRAVSLLVEPDPTESQTLAAVAFQAFVYQQPAPDPGRVADALRRLACDAEHAPHVARGILRQIELGPERGGRDLGDHRPALARALLDDQACPGGRGLTARERAILQEIADGRD